MRLLAGFDAGQTHTRCRLSVVQNGVHQPVGEGEGPGVSHLDAPQGERRFLEAISTSAQEALKKSINQNTEKNSRKSYKHLK